MRTSNAPFLAGLVGNTSQPELLKKKENAFNIKLLNKVCLVAKLMSLLHGRGRHHHFFYFYFIFMSEMTTHIFVLSEAKSLSFCFDFFITKNYSSNEQNYRCNIKNIRLTLPGQLRSPVKVEFMLLSILLPFFVLRICFAINLYGDFHIFTSWLIKFIYLFLCFTENVPPA